MSLAISTMFSWQTVVAFRLTFVLLWNYASRGTGMMLAPVYWNSSNPIFKSSRNSLIVDVNLYDEIDFVCPHYTSTPPSSVDIEDDAEPDQLPSPRDEFYVIYQVTRDQFDECYVDIHGSDAVMIVNCSDPTQRRRFTLLFEPFQSIPNTPEYVPGESYYYLTTSTGSRDGLSNIYRGACFHRNMKLVLRVCCADNRLADDNADDYDYDENFKSPLFDDVLYSAAASDAIVNNNNNNNNNLLPRPHQQGRRPQQSNNAQQRMNSVRQLLLLLLALSVCSVSITRR